MCLVIVFSLGFIFWAIIDYIYKLKQTLTQIETSNQELQQSNHELERLVVRAWNDHHRSKRILLTFIFRNPQSILDFLTSSDSEILYFRNENKEIVRILHDKYKNKE